jgi:sulfotransferase
MAILAPLEFASRRLVQRASQMITVRYESLVRDPEAVMYRLYAKLHEERFPHDFNNVEYDEPDYDAQIGLPGLHRVRPKVEYKDRITCLSPDFFTKHKDVNFWASPKLNRRNVIVI